MAVRKTGDASGFAGLMMCGSVWVCPVCNAKIMSRRALEIGSAVALAQRSGFHVAFVTLTMRHFLGQALTMLWGALSYAWGAVTAGMPWQKIKARFGIVGFLRVVEVTVGRNGWHVHVHALVFLDPAQMPDDAPETPDVAALQAAMFERWSNALQRKGLDAPLIKAQDARLLDGPADEALSQYLTKAQDNGMVTHRKIGLELTSSQSKKARNEFSTRTPWELLDEWFGDGLADSAELWWEFEKASKGKRQLTWSRGLRELLGLVQEKTDEEIAAEEIGSKADDLVHISKEGWRMVLRQPDLIPMILNTTDRQGLTGLRALLDEHGIDYDLPEETSDDD